MDLPLENLLPIKIKSVTNLSPDWSVSTVCFIVSVSCILSKQDTVLNWNEYWILKCTFPLLFYVSSKMPANLDTKNNVIFHDVPGRFFVNRF